MSATVGLELALGLGVGEPLAPGRAVVRPERDASRATTRSRQTMTAPQAARAPRGVRARCGSEVAPGLPGSMPPPYDPLLCTYWDRRGTPPSRGGADLWRDGPRVAAGRLRTGPQLVQAVLDHLQHLHPVGVLTLVGGDRREPLEVEGADAVLQAPDRQVVVVGEAQRGVVPRCSALGHRR